MGRRLSVVGLVGGVVAALSFAWLSAANLAPRPSPSALGRRELSEKHLPAERIAFRSQAHGASPFASPAAPVVPEQRSVDFVQPPKAPPSYRNLLREDANDAAKEAPRDDRDESDLDVSEGRQELAARERIALRLYTSMGAVFEQLDGRCDLIGERIAQLVDEQGADLKATSRSGLSARADQVNSSQSLGNELADAQLERFRAQLRSTLGKCPGNQALLGALRRLSLLASS